MRSIPLLPSGLGRTKARLATHTLRVAERHDPNTRITPLSRYELIGEHSALTKPSSNNINSDIMAKALLLNATLDILLRCTSLRKIVNETVCL